MQKILTQSKTLLFSHQYKCIDAKNPKNAIIGHLNVNPLRNKFVAINELMKNKIDTCLISETKVDESFPNQQFKINGYKLFRKDRASFGRGLTFYVNV